MANDIIFGSTSLADLKFGTSNVSKVMLGSSEVWSNSGGNPWTDFDDDCSSLTGWTETTTGSSKINQKTGYFEIKGNSGYGEVAQTLAQTIPSEYWLEVNCAHPNIGGSYTVANWFHVFDGTYKLQVCTCKAGIYIQKGLATGTYITNTDYEDSTYRDFQFHVNGDGTVDCYVNDSLIKAAVDMYANTATPKRIAFRSKDGGLGSSQLDINNILLQTDSPI